MFTQKCIIKKKFDKEFLSNLNRIGYSIADLGGDEFDCEYILTMNPFSTIDFLWSNHGHDDVVNNGVIDCGTNEELFLAIAALRDDTDKNQWFIHTNLEFVFCDQSELKHVIDNTDEYMDYCVADFHKATVQELIEHFKP